MLNLPPGMTLDALLMMLIIGSSSATIMLSVLPVPVRAWAAVVSPFKSEMVRVLATISTSSSLGLMVPCTNMVGVLPIGKPAKPPDSRGYGTRTRTLPLLLRLVALPAMGRATSGVPPAFALNTISGSAKPIPPALVISIGTSTSLSRGVVLRMEKIISSLS